MEAFSSFINYNWLGFSNNLQKNVAAHCLATSFSQYPRLNFKLKYKIRGSTEKILNSQRFLYRPRSIHTCQKRTHKILTHTPFKATILPDIRGLKLLSLEKNQLENRGCVTIKLVYAFFYLNFKFSGDVAANTSEILKRDLSSSSTNPLAACDTVPLKPQPRRLHDIFMVGDYFKTLNLLKN